MTFSPVKTYSIMIMVAEAHESKADGYWLQDHIGTIESAQERLNSYHAKFGENTRYFVTDGVTTTSPILHGKFTDCNILAQPQES